MTVTRIAFRTEMRSAAMSMLTAFAADASIKLQIYRGRPRSVMPPCAFVDTISEDFEYSNVSWRMRTASLEVVVLHGLFDSGEAVDQADALADEFLDWVTDNLHAAGGNTTVAVRTVTDDPTYVPDWLPPDLQRTYYATRITLEGHAGG